MLILVINCGSSSAKYQLFDVKRREPVAKGVVERIGQDGASVRHNHVALGRVRKASCADHYVAIRLIVDALTDRKYGVIGSTDDIAGIGHRVVHGGEEFKSSTIITPEVVQSIEKYSELAPLHNPPSLLGIKACSRILKGIPQVAVFDTAFHQTMSPKAFLYGLPFRLYKKYGIRRYGFHGTSHRYVSGQAPSVLKRSAKALRLVTCHLGNGCSMAAVKGGRSMDTTMGFTPLEGLMMGTRSGDLDPAVVFFLMDKEKLSPDKISAILNKESGLLGVSGVGNDMRDIIKTASGVGESARRAKLAIGMFVYRIEKYIGAYMAAMGGLDAVIFTAGIGENNPWLIKRIGDDLKGIVPADTRFLVIPTNEEMLIAQDTFEKVRNLKRKI
jgi:acetate kinase